MSSMCKSSSIPTRATYDNLYRRPESDAEFVKSVVGRKQGDNVSAPATATLQNKRKWTEAPEVVDSYSCRRMFLKSYTFTKKESLFEKTMKRLGKLKERPSFVKRKASNDEKKNRTKKEVCLDVREESTRVYYVVVRSVLFRLLSCTATIDGC